MKTWFTSDLHLGHPLVAGKRGFFLPDGKPDTDAHNTALLKLWNQVVDPGDIVWVLGDVCVGDPARIWHWLDKLHGTKRLIEGNHDACASIHKGSWKYQDTYHAHFQSVQAFAKLRLEGEDVLLSHYPYTGDSESRDRPDGTERYTQWRLRDEGRFLLHGHVHSELKLWGGRQIHVGLDAWGLRPVPVESIMQIIRQTKAAEEHTRLGVEVQC